MHQDSIMAIRYLIGVPLLYVAIGGLILRAAVSSRNWMYGVSPSPPPTPGPPGDSRAAPCTTSAGNAPPARAGQPGDASIPAATGKRHGIFPSADSGGDRTMPVIFVDYTKHAPAIPLDMPSLPRAFGAAALSLLFHYGVLFPCSFGCRDEITTWIMLTLFSLPVHYFLEAWLVSVATKAPIHRCGGVVAIQVVLWMAAIGAVTALYYAILLITN